MQLSRATRQNNGHPSPVPLETAPQTGSCPLKPNRAFSHRRTCRQENIPAFTINADAFLTKTKEQAIELIQCSMGKIDLLIYSLAAPRRYDPQSGKTYYSAIKPIGRSIATKSLDFMNFTRHDSVLFFVENGSIEIGKTTLEYFEYLNRKGWF